MGLKTVVALLLPRDHRDQILGDLCERGFRLGDIASVLPAAWSSHLRRQWRTPNLIGASDATLLRRADQFRRRNITLAIALMILWAGPKAYTILLMPLSVIAFLVLAASILGYFAVQNSMWAPPIPLGRQAILERHRTHIRTSRVSIPMLGFSALNAVLKIAVSTFTRPQRAGTAVMVFGVYFALVWLRDRSLRKELEALS